MVELAVVAGHRVSSPVISRSIWAVLMAIGLSFFATACSDVVGPPDLRLIGNDICATDAIEETSGAGSTIFITRIYGIYWCEGVEPEAEATQLAQIESVLSDFHREGNGSPPKFRSRRATAILYRLEQFKEISPYLLADPMIRDSRATYILVVDAA